jgi:hypothetical protein
LNGIHIAKQIERQLKMTNVQGEQAPAKRQKILKKKKKKKKKSKTHPRRRCRTIHELAEAAGISYVVCKQILREHLKICRTAAKFVLGLLTNDQKQRRVNVLLELREKAN